VSQFEKANASENFERSIEVVGSLAVQSYQRGYAVGLVTNGVVKEGSSFVSMGRSPQQLASILEILARLKMRTDANLKDILNRSLESPWYFSGVHFSYEHDEETMATANFFSHRRIPMIFVACVSQSQSEINGHRLGAKLYCLDEICIEEALRP
jgi:hypothetical protein